MKKILFFILVILNASAFGQPAKPSGAVDVATFKILRTSSDSVLHIYLGSTLGYYSFRMQLDTTRMHTGVATLYRLSKTVQLKDSATNVKGYKTYYSSRVQDVTNNATYYPLLTTATSGQYLAYVSSSKLSFNPSTGNLTATIFQLSDRRLKGNISNLSAVDYLNIRNIPFVKYTMNDDPLKKVHFGFIAQDVEKYYPNMVNTSDKGIKTVNYNEVLIAKIAEMENRINELEREVKYLKKNKKDKWRAEKCTIVLP